MSVFRDYVFGKVAWEAVDETTRNLWKIEGWITERGGVLDAGFEANSIKTADAHILELGCDTTIHGHILPKGTEFALVWFNNGHKQRRNWFYTLVTGVKQDDGTVAEMRFNLIYNSKHQIKVRKLPIDTEKQPVLQ